MKIKVDKYSINIRKATWDDYAYCYNLFKKNLKPIIEKHWVWVPGRFRRNFNPPKCRILEYNNKRSGFYQVPYENGIAYLEEMHVSTRLRGKGIGTKILMLIESEARKRKCKIIRLQVFKENPAKRLYEKLGYKIKKDIKSSVLMEKKI